MESDSLSEALVTWCHNPQKTIEVITAMKTFKSREKGKVVPVLN
jgi:hypothetical protein